MNSKTRCNLRAGVALALLGMLSTACWDHEAYPPDKFGDDMCKIVNNYRAQVGSTCNSFPTQAQRAQCLAQTNPHLYALTQQKLTAVIAYANCAEAQLEASQKIASEALKALITAAGMFGGNLALPGVGQFQSKIKGQGGGDDNGFEVLLDPGSAVCMKTNYSNKLIGPLDVAGKFAVDLLSTSAGGYEGAVTLVDMTVSHTSGLNWKVTQFDDPYNTFDLAPAVGGFHTGEFHAVLEIQGRGIHQVLGIKLPLRVPSDLSQWDLTTGPQMIPAEQVFPVVSAVNYDLGPGCVSSSGYAPYTSPASIPRIGDELIIRLFGAQPGSTAFFAFGDSSPFFGGLLLPYPLGGLGAPGCSLRVNPMYVQSVQTSATGEAEWRWKIPVNSNLVGLEARVQWLTTDPVNALGLVVSNAQKLWVYGQ